MATLRRERERRGTSLPAGAWHVCETTWGEAQRVRLVTGVPSLAESPERVRSIHAVGFVRNGGDADHLLLVQNKDGSFTFPGGRLEGAETPDAALKREVWEEARAILLPDPTPIAATRIEFLNRVPGRIHRVHPSYLLWVVAEVASLSDEACIDPAPNGVIGRRIVPVSEAQALLFPPASLVLEAALSLRKETA
ncbi:MAG: NUDIX domain-containing protein [Fibrella sp.]|nr:NUDIX domain-containing protein [Armatimonadota bacterium]